MVVKVKEYFEKLDMLKIMPILKSLNYVDKEMRDIVNGFYLIKRNLIISTFNTDFVNFLENGNRYKVEFFRVY